VNPPEGLSGAGLAAWGRANRALEGHPDLDLLVEAAARYAYAVDLAAMMNRKLKRAAADPRTMRIHQATLPMTL
jgi:hypothetical protein